MIRHYCCRIVLFDKGKPMFFELLDSVFEAGQISVS